MGASKIIYGGEVLINLTDATVTTDTLEEGVTAYGATGDRITGTGLPGRVRYDVEQSLTEEEQQRAQSNLGIKTLSGADWEAGEGEPGYVANRTHYTSTTTTQLCNEIVDNQREGSLHDFSTLFNITPGLSYKIVVNDVTYNVVAYTSTVGPAIGAPEITEEEYDFSSIPIVIWLDEEDEAIFCVTSLIGELSVQVIGPATIIKKLDSAYLPTNNWNAGKGQEGYIANRTHWTEIIEKTIFFDGTCNSTGMRVVEAPRIDDLEIENFDPEKQYKISFDGEDYILYPYEDPYYVAIYLGAILPSDAFWFDFSVFPFNISLRETTISICCRDIGVHTVRVSEVETIIHKLDSVYLPEGLVKSINGLTPDETGNIEISAGGTGVHIDAEEPTDKTVLWLDIDDDSDVGGGALDVVAEVGQTIVVKVTDENGKPTEWESVDYQPRTHYTEVIEKAILFDGTWDFSEANPWDFPRQDGKEDDFDLNKQYRVILDGHDYILYPHRDAYGNHSLGADFQENGIFLDFSVYPFYFTCYDDEIKLNCKTLEVHTIRVSEVETVVHKIDPMYLPEGVGYSEVIEILPEITVEIDPEMEGGLIPIEFTVEGDKEYVVKYNGVEYATTCYVLEGQFFLGNIGAVDGSLPVTEDPFLVAYIEAGEDDNGNPVYTWVVAPLDGAASVTLSIEQRTLKKIEDKYLPDASIPCRLDVYPDGALYKTSTTAEELLAAYKAGRTITAYVHHGSETARDLLRLESMNTDGTNTIRAEFGSLGIFDNNPRKSMTRECLTVSWQFGDAELTCDYFFEPVKFSVQEWATNAVPAAVGQYFRVASVDDSGNVTAVEAVDAPSGGGDKWEKLNEFTLEENAMSVMLNADADGNPFSLKKMRIFMYLPKCKTTSGEDASTGYTTYQINGTVPSAYCYPSNGWDNAYFVWTIEAFNKYMFIECLKMSAYDQTQVAERFHERMGGNRVAYNGTITSFLWTVFSPTADKPSAMAGATFEVWGVRA